MIKICVRPGWLMLVVCTFRNIDASVQPHEAKPAKSVANLQFPASRMLLLADLDGGMRQAAPLWFSFVLQLCRWYSRYESVWRYHKIYDAYIYIYTKRCLYIHLYRPWEPMEAMAADLGAEAGLRRPGAKEQDAQLTEQEAPRAQHGPAARSCRLYQVVL